MKPKNFILVGFIFVILIFISYILTFFFQLHAPLKAEYWINSAYKYKDFKAKTIKKKKIIIISGSNSLFGINSEIIENITGYPVINLAVHAGLDIDFLYYKIKNHIKEGDIIVMPLEFGYYTKAKSSRWFSNNIMSWGNGYLKELSILNLLNFIVTTEPTRVFKGVVKQIESDSNNQKIIQKDKIINTLESLWKKDGAIWRGYSYKSLNKNGDINADKIFTYKGDPSYLSDSIKISKRFIATYNKINKLVENNNGKLLVTYPVTIKNPNFDLSKDKFQNIINNFEKVLLRKTDIDIKCNPALFNLDRTYFFNTSYHPNKYGALIRSENLANCIKLINETKYKKVSYTDAIVKTKILEDKYFSVVKKPSKLNYEIRLKDLSEIKIALNKYFKDNGSFPKSKGYDGLYTKWGYSGKEWINGLVPKYLKSLPIDPRNTKDGSKQYLYKSNGKDFKLIAHSTEDSYFAVKKNSNMLDPKRKSAYGFWTEGAEQW